MLHRGIVRAVLPPDAERDLVLNGVGDLAKAIDQVRRTCPLQVGSDRRVAAGDVEADADNGHLIAVGGDAANRHDVAQVTVGHQRSPFSAARNVLELRQRLWLVLSKDRELAHGGNPIANLTAEYSGCTCPSAVRIISGGSTHVLSRMVSGRSGTRIITNSPMSGASPSLNTTGRCRTTVSSALPAAVSIRPSCSSGKTQAKTPPDARCLAATLA